MHELSRQDLTFQAQLWEYTGPTSWFFISLPQELSEQIRFHYPLRNGFGSLKVRIFLGASCWESSIFPSKSEQTFILPIKAAVRKAEKIVAGDKVTLRIELLDKANLF